MHIMDKPAVRTPRQRREHSAEFKRDLVARSLEPDVSVAAIAMEGGKIGSGLRGQYSRHDEPHLDEPSLRVHQLRCGCRNMPYAAADIDYELLDLLHPLELPANGLHDGLPVT
jgi:hypothetical protein